MKDISKDNNYIDARGKSSKEIFEIYKKIATEEILREQKYKEKCKKRNLKKI